MLIRSATISKEELKNILRLAGSDKERECISYTAFRASGLSQTVARRFLGLENMNYRADQVQAALEEVQAIRESVESMAHIQEKAVLETYGAVNSDSNYSSHSTESESDSESEDESCWKHCEGSYSSGACISFMFFFQLL